MDFKIIRLYRRVLLDRLRYDIVERQVIMRLDVRHNISRIVSRCIAWLCFYIIQDGLDASRAAGNKPRLSLGAIAGFQFVTNLVREYADAVRLIHPILIGSLACERRIGFMSGKRPPALADKECVWVNGCSRINSLLHGIVRCIAHHIPAHAVNFVLLEPVLHGIHHKLLRHFVVRCQIVAEAANEAAIRLLECIIIRDDIIQKIRFGHMRIDHIEDDAHARFMNRVNQALKLLDSQLGISRILRISAVRRKIIVRVVAPVVFVAQRGIIQLSLAHA
ncbi:hypothetical protein D3C78_861800 [compost metagenome]